jgi:hypothetical protein
MNKHPLKSKTMCGIFTVIIIALMNIMGVGEAEIGNTYDTITNSTGQKTESAKDIGLVVGGAFAAYGRYKVKGGKDEE